MTKTVRLKKIFSLALAVVIVVCTFLFTATSASAAEENTPQTVANENMYDTCDIYVRSDVYPVVIHYVTCELTGSSLDLSRHYVMNEYDVTLYSETDYITLETTKGYKPLDTHFTGAVITSIKCQGYNPTSCSISFNSYCTSWEGNLLSVNKFDKTTPYFYAYLVEDTSSKTIDTTFLGGYDNGYSDGYEKGVQDGYDTGYDYGFRLGQEGGNNSNTDTGTTDTDTSVTENEDWKTMLGIGAVLILLALIVLGVSKVSKEIKQKGVRK